MAPNAVVEGGRHPAVSVAETLTGRAGIVDLWCYFYESVKDAPLLAEQRALLAEDELARLPRFHFERDRRQFLATRALARVVLSSYAPVAPSAWRFVAGEHGKPRVAHPPIPRPLFFNLANTTGLVVCAVSVAHELVGVDVERMDRKSEFLDLADRFFSPLEARALRALPDEQRAGRFFEFWTLKESYIKARGLGLAIPLDKFSFQLADGAISVTFEEELADDPARWRFAFLESPFPYRIATGVETGGVEMSLRVKHIVPLLTIN